MYVDSRCRGIRRRTRNLETIHSLRFLRRDEKNQRKYINMFVDERKIRIKMNIEIVTVVSLIRRCKKMMEKRILRCMYCRLRLGLGKNWNTSNLSGSSGCALVNFVAIKISKQRSSLRIRLDRLSDCSGCYRKNTSANSSEWIFALAFAITHSSVVQWQFRWYSEAVFLEK